MATETEIQRYRTVAKQLLAGDCAIDALDFAPPSTVIVTHQAAATTQQRANAQAILAAFDWNAAPPAPSDLADGEAFTLNGEPRRFPNLAVLFMRRNWFQYGRTPADRTTTSTTAVNVLPLSFSADVNEEWIFSFRLRVGSSSAAGIKVALTFPAGATLRATVKGNSGAVTTISSEQITASGTLGQVWCAAAINNGWLEIDGVIVNGATAGTVQLQAAKVTSGTATVFQGSYVDAQRRG